MCSRANGDHLVLGQEQGQVRAGVTPLDIGAQKPLALVMGNLPSQRLAQFPTDTIMLASLCSSTRSRLARALPLNRPFHVSARRCDHFLDATPEVLSIRAPPPVERSSYTDCHPYLHRLISCFHNTVTVL